MANGISIPVPQVTTLGQAISGGLQQAQNIAKTKQDLQTARAQLPLIQAQTEAAQALQSLRGAQTELAQKEAAQLATTTPFSQADQQQLQKDLVTINTNAVDVKENDIPLYTQLKAALAHVPLGTGILRGQVLWATPQGQYLQALLRRAQGNYIKNFHLGRMTQREFDILRQAVGGGTTKTATLNALIDRQLNQDQTVLNKQAFYYHYIKQNGRSANEVANRWLNTLGKPKDIEPQTKTLPKTESVPSGNGDLKEARTLSNTQLLRIAHGGQ